MHLFWRGMVTPTQEVCQEEQEPFLVGPVEDPSMHSFQSEHHPHDGRDLSTAGEANVRRAKQSIFFFFDSKPTNHTSSTTLEWDTHITIYGSSKNEYHKCDRASDQCRTHDTTSWTESEVRAAMPSFGKFRARSDLVLNLESMLKDTGFTRLITEKRIVD